MDISFDELPRLGGYEIEELRNENTSLFESEGKEAV